MKETVWVPLWKHRSWQVCEPFKWRGTLWIWVRFMSEFGAVGTLWEFLVYGWCWLSENEKKWRVTVPTPTCEKPRHGIWKVIEEYRQQVLVHKKNKVDSWVCSVYRVLGDKHSHHNLYVSYQCYIPVQLGRETHNWRSWISVSWFRCITKKLGRRNRELRSRSNEKLQGVNVAIPLETLIMIGGERWRLQDTHCFVFG